MILERQEAEGWGAKVIDQLAADLREDGARGFSRSNLKYMRAFAEAWPKFDSGAAGKGQQLVGQMPWGHNILLLTKLGTPGDRLWYAERAASEGWSRKVLEHHVVTDLKGRQRLGASNFSTTLAPPDSDLARELLTDPLDLSFVPGESIKSERDLELALLREIERFMLNFGARELTFAGRQWRLDVGGEEFFVDLLFFHVGLLRWVVVELKIGKFQPEFAGKLNFYVNAIDNEVRKPSHGPTIGILLCAERNEQVVEYSLSGVVSPIGIATYRIDEAELKSELPPDLKGQLPEPEQLQANLERIVAERGGEIDAVLDGNEGRDADER
jgi:predicted nuclease of restriction endonuclease-like (RecB) superfamily